MGVLEDLLVNIMRIIAALIAIAALTGCVHNKHRTEEATAYVNAQKETIKARPPLFELKAKEGEHIVLQGVESITVHDPRIQEVKPLPAQRSQAVEFLGKLVDAGAGVAKTKIGADAAVDVVTAIMDRSGDHSVTTTTITDSYNPDNSSRGDEINDSQIIGGNVEGPGAGIGNQLDASVGGDAIDHNSGRIESPDDHSGQDNDEIDDDSTVTLPPDDPPPPDPNPGGGG